jgi:RHS repeat-associated protein
MPVAMKMGSATYYLSYDQVGSLRLVADGSGNVVKRIGYDSFGNILEDTNPSFTIPFGFAGGLHDRDTGLVRFGYRDYDPEVGRWTAKDPIGFAGGDTDLYGYCLSDPVNIVDALGLFNYAKAAVSIGNAAIAGFTAASGAIKIGIATALLPATATIVGALPPTALLAWGTWNIKSSLAAWQRSAIQWDEAFSEEWADASWKNLYGLLPGGTGYDDPCEPSGPINYIRSRGWYQFLVEAGYF